MGKCTVHRCPLSLTLIRWPGTQFLHIVSLLSGDSSCCFCRSGKSPWAARGQVFNNWNDRAWLLLHLMQFCAPLIYNAKEMVKLWILHLQSRKHYEPVFGLLLFINSKESGRGRSLSGRLSGWQRVAKATAYLLVEPVVCNQMSKVFLDGLNFQVCDSHPAKWMIVKMIPVTKSYSEPFSNGSHPRCRDRAW